MITKIRLLATIVSAVFFVNSVSYSQGIETVGAGVIDFLLTNPKTASKTNATEAAALGVIGNLLSISGQRKHEMNVANAGRSEIVINTTSGSQATMYADNQGNLYLLFNGTIYPISSGLINQAKGIKDYTTVKKRKVGTLEPYDIEKLKNKYVDYSKKISGTIIQVYIVPGKKETLFTVIATLSSLANTTYYEMKRIIVANNSYITSSMVEKPYTWKLRGGRQVVYIKNIYRKKNKLNCIFTAKWHQDFDNSGYIDFDEFKYIKRIFKQNEDFEIVCSYNVGTPDDITITTKIINDYTGQLFTKTKYPKIINKPGGYLHFKKITSNTLPPGIYIITVEISFAENSVDENKKISKKIKIIP